MVTCHDVVFKKFNIFVLKAFQKETIENLMEKRKICLHVFTSEDWRWKELMLPCIPTIIFQEMRQDSQNLLSLQILMNFFLGLALVFYLPVFIFLCIDYKQAY